MRNEELPLGLDDKQTIVREKIDSLISKFKKISGREISLIKSIKNCLWNMEFHPLEEIADEIADGKEITVMDVYNMLEFLRDRGIVQYPGTYANAARLDFDKY